MMSPYDVTMVTLYGDTVVIYGDTMVSPCGVIMWCHVTMVSPYGFPRVSQWCHVTMVTLRCRPVVSPWCPYGINMVSPCSVTRV